MIAHIYPSVLQAGTGAGSNGAPSGGFQRYRGGAMQDLGYELPRIHILGTWVNSGRRERRGKVYVCPGHSPLPFTHWPSGAN
jgi:hypothetical protein